MSTIGNIIWILTGGIVGAILWCAAGLLLCVTVVGIPFGIQCFKIASLQPAPFGKRIVSDPGGAVMGLPGNIVWVILCGRVLAVAHVAMGLIFAVTVCGRAPLSFEHARKGFRRPD